MFIMTHGQTHVRVVISGSDDSSSNCSKSAVIFPLEIFLV